MHPFKYSSLRRPRVCPSQFLSPLVRRSNLFAMPLQTSMGLSWFTRFVHGAPCLHSFLFFLEAHALGITRFSCLVFGSTTSLWMWCWQRLWKYWKARQKNDANSAPPLGSTGDVVLSLDEHAKESGMSLASS